MRCPKCNAELNQQAQFCWQCGAAIAAAAQHGPAGQRPMAGVGAPRSAPGPVHPTMVSAPAARRVEREPVRRVEREPARRDNRWMAVVAVLLLLVAVIVLLITLGMRQGKSVTASGTHVKPAPPVTSAPPQQAPAPPVTTTPPADLKPSAPVATGPQRPADYNDVAEYLRKLEAIERRDAQNPMIELTATMATLMTAASGGLQGLGDEDAPEKGAAKEVEKAKQAMAGVLQAKAMLHRDFNAITPVPMSCQLLHRTYGSYLSAQEKAIGELQSAVQTQNMAAPLAALPLGQAAATAQTAATAQEDALRKLYGIPRSFVP